MSDETTKIPMPRSGVLGIQPYTQGASEIEGIEETIKLSSNESSFGPSPAALAAYKNAAATLHRYPDGSQTALRVAIAKAFDLEAANIVCGNGSDELIQIVTRTFVDEGDEVLMSEHTFLMCHVHARAQGANIVIAPEKNNRVDVDALLERVTERTRLLPLANPNNPTGTYISIDEIRRLHAGLPGNVILLLDGAYAEYAMAEDFDAGLDLVLANKNIVVTRTFSKIFGLSALRIGWAYAPDNILDAIHRVRTPFNANGPAMAAATAAVADSAYTEHVRSHTARSIKKISKRLSALGLEVVPSVTNFYLIRFPKGGGITASLADQRLRAAGIIPRPMGAANDTDLRITVGSDEENDAVLREFETLMKSQAN